MYKKPLALMLLLMVAIPILASCGGSSDSNSIGSNCTPVVSVSDLKLIKSGILTVGSDTTYAPMEFIDVQSSDPIGFDVDFANALAKKLCLNAKVTTTSFTGILDTLTSGSLGQQRSDIVISSMTITDERSKQVNFVPYFQAGQSILVAKGNPKGIKSINDLCGRNVAVQKATAEEDDINQNINAAGGACASNNIKAISFEKQTDVIDQLLVGRVDATYQDSPVTNYFEQKNATKIEKGVVLVSPSPIGIAIRKDDDPMKKALETAYDAIRKDGSYKKALEKWNLIDSAYPALP
jgi:polar amino acid transport system substrate-binding protein